MNNPKKKVLVVGGGFGGIRAAIELDVHARGSLDVTLISDKPHFEYHAALYRVVTGRSPLEVCIPVADILKGTHVNFVKDRIENIDFEKKKIFSSHGFDYDYDYLVLALGSETAFFNIPGLKELSFGFRSISEALRLKRHLHEVFESCKKGTQEQNVCSAHIVVVGGGASGVELAGELAEYTKKLSAEHGLDHTLVTIDLIEAANRLLPMLVEKASKAAEHRLRHLGVNIFLNRAVVEEEVEKVYLKDMELKTQTVIWTAGIKNNSFYSKFPQFQFDKKGRVIVDEMLRAKGMGNVFVVGDSAATQYSGMAQTAIRDALSVADTITRFEHGYAPQRYVPVRPYYSIPVGPGWAVTVIGSIVVTGKIGWFLRRFADFRFFKSILPWPKAIAAFSSGKTVCESCEICSIDP